MSFLLGIIVAIVLYKTNDALKSIMTKIHENTPEELSKLKIPGYAFYSYYRFKRYNN